jgi:signal transduction histidine kinase/ligand-binding sensor domain-containing protein/DNA-binding response OmpR family regulator
MENGLPQNMIDCILQDSKGFMWFGTWSGLCRFDGYTFKVFKEQDTGYSTISNNYIYALSEDHNGNIWIATNAGINIYQYKQDYFRTPLSDSSLTKFFSGKISGIAKSNDSTLWIGIGNNVYNVKIDGDSKIIALKPYKISDSSEININYLYCDRGFNLWIASNKGVIIRKKNSGQFSYLYSNWSIPNTISFNAVKNIFEDSEGIIWISTEFGLNSYNPKTLKITNFIHIPFHNKTLIHSYITSVAEDANRNILIGTLGGLSIYKKNITGIFENYVKSSSTESSINNDFINCIYKDRSGNIWIGTELGGINKYNSAKSNFEYFENEAGQPNTLSNNMINSICEDSAFIWIGTAGGGLNKYNKKTDKFNHYQNRYENSPTNINNFISVLYRDNNNKLWVGSWGEGLYVLQNENTNNEKFINYRPLLYGKGLINDFVSSIISDKNGNLWIGTFEGLDKLNCLTKEFEHISLQIKGFKIDRIGCLLFDKKNNLWIGSQNGLFKISFDKNNNISKVLHFTKDEKRQNSLTDNYITYLLEDSRNNIWIGTYGFGVNKFESEKLGGTFTSYTMDDGLPNNIIYTISEDNSGYLWLTTDYGLSRFNIKEKTFKNFFISDGLLNNKYYWNAIFKNGKGKLYVGGLNGLNAFYPDSILDKRTDIFPVAITHFKINNEPVKPTKKYNGEIAISQSISLAKKITISYKSQEIGFEFSALDYEQSTSIKYAYKLNGFETKWHEVSSDRRFAIYTNLEPGRYTFMVKSTNRNGDWANTSTQIKLIVVPPFWNTWWFKILTTFLFLAIIVLYNRYRVYNLEMQKRKLEKQVFERTAKIEEQKERLRNQNSEIQKQQNQLIKLNKEVVSANEFKLNFFTNISHEFRTPLTLIIGPIENLMKAASTSKVTKETLTLVHKNTQRLLHLINQLMDFRKIEQGKMSLHISKVNAKEFVENIVLSFSSLAKQKDIELQFLNNNGKAEIWVDCQKIENILYNLLSNAFKNTPGKGKIDIKIHEGKDSDPIIMISVSDTGVGISENNLPLIFNRFYQIESKTNNATGTGIGLALTKELVECHKGSIKVESKPGHGSCFTISIPVTREFYNTADFSEHYYEPANLNIQVSNLATELFSYSSGEHFTNKQNYSNIENRPTILIVEDNNDLRAFIANRLNKTYNILEAENGKTGFNLAFSKSPNIIVSDIMMPEMNGLELCNKIKETFITSHIPVLLLTSKTEIEDEIEGLETGADRYLPKPFDFYLLEAHIANLLETRKKLFETFLYQKEINTQVLATTSLDEKFLKQVAQIIDENIDNPEFSVSSLAKEMLISRGYLHKKMISLSNLSPIDFIINIRLKKSLGLLHNFNKNISEVAYAVGYNDPKYFSRLFKKQFGQSPTEYQENIQTNRPGPA